MRRCPDVGTGFERADVSSHSKISNKSIRAGKAADSGRVGQLDLIDKALTCWTKWTNLASVKTVNVHEAKTAFSRLLAGVEKRNQSVVICRNGEPVADLVPHRQGSRTRPHPQLRKIKIKYDPIAPLSAEEWPRASR